METVAGHFQGVYKAHSAKHEDLSQVDTCIKKNEGIIEAPGDWVFTSWSQEGGARRHSVQYLVQYFDGRYRTLADVPSVIRIRR